ncbi:enoyl-CoA hydratase/isomerase family protein [Pararhodobacter sp.]|uniref:enoyl-CoA hydratase/isomerase family protein n=1 Tax=Pararhodobacter sp. TaxID=2127056 RepID=UPI002FDDD6DC
MPARNDEANEAVLFTLDDGIAHVTLNRPHCRNAISVETANTLTALWSRIEADPHTLAVVLDAADCGVFCAGMDLKEMAAIRAKGDDPLALMHDPFQQRLQTLSKPVVCALVGHFAGAGMLLAMGADVRIAMRGTTAAISEVRFGRGTPWAVPLLWMLPQPVLSEMMLTGDPVPVEDLARYGFVNHLEDRVEDVRDHAFATARRIARNAPLSVRAAKASLAAGMDLGRVAGLARAAELHRDVYASDDASEGPRAFSEGRAPRWTGR